MTEIFDRRLVRLNRARSSSSFGNHDFLLRDIQTQFLERLQDTRKTFTTSLITGLDPSFMKAQVADLSQTKDMTSVFGDWSSARLKTTLLDSHGVVFEDHQMPFRDHHFDLVLNGMSFQWLNDVPGGLREIRRILKPDGLCLLAFLGGETLHELRASLLAAELSLTGGAHPRVAPVIDLATASALFQGAGFALPVVDRDTLTATYPSLKDLLHELKAMGEGNGLTARTSYLSRALFQKTEEIYGQKYRDPEGRLVATFEVIYLTGWAPAYSQPKALKPGTATHSLADFL